jgi:hypothetical protein
MVDARAAMREGRDGRMKEFKVRCEKLCQCGVSGVERCGGLEVTGPHDTVSRVIVGEAKALCHYFGI